MTSNSLQPQMYDNQLNIQILRCLTLGAVQSVLSNQNGGNQKSKTLELMKKKTLIKYLPAKFEMCMKVMETVLIDKVKEKLMMIKNKIKIENENDKNDGRPIMIKFII